MAVESSPRDCQGVQSARVDDLALVELKCQIARRDIPDVAIIQQITVIRLNAHDLRTDGQQPAFLQRFDAQVATCAAASTLLASLPGLPES